MEKLTNDEILDEYKYDWIKCLELKQDQIFFLEKFGNSEMNDIYIDQMAMGGFASTILLRTGLKRMESWMIREITRGKDKSEFTFEQMQKMIQLNPHLHNIIKTNLLDNLNNWNEKDI